MSPKNPNTSGSTNTTNDLDTLSYKELLLFIESEVRVIHNELSEYSKEELLEIAKMMKGGYLLRIKLLKSISNLYKQLLIWTTITFVGASIINQRLNRLNETIYQSNNRYYSAKVFSAKAETYNKLRGIIDGKKLTEAEQVQLMSLYNEIKIEQDELISTNNIRKVTTKAKKFETMESVITRTYKILIFNAGKNE